MTVERIIELLENEKECVLRNASGECNRYCAGCDLLQDDTELHEMYTDAIALLKAQEPRVMTPADVNNIGPEDVCAFIEIREEAHMYACYMHQYDETHTEIMCNVPDMPTKLQNGCARLWTSRPTDEQRKKTPWEGR